MIKTLINKLDKQLAEMLLINKAIQMLCLISMLLHLKEKCKGNQSIK